MQRKIREPRVGADPTSPDSRSNALLTELSELYEILIANSSTL